MTPKLPQHCRVYLVGGAVRDQLMGVPIGDRDYVVVGARPEEMLAAGFVPVGKDFPVFIHPVSGAEYALARTEKKSGKGYHGFQINADPGVTLEQDLSRRDLTINAMAQDESGAVIDPYGGQRDLAQKVFRHVSSAFAEDPVRILRLARFAARMPGFEVAQETNELIQHMVASGEVDALVPERVWKEISRGLAELALERMFDVLHQGHALKVVFPELHKVWSGETSSYLSRLSQVTQQPIVRFAAILLLIGDANSLTQLMHRWNPPAEYIEIATLLLRDSEKLRDLTRQFREFNSLAGPQLHCPEDFANNVVQLLERGDAIRRPARFELVLQADEAHWLSLSSVASPSLLLGNEPGSEPTSTRHLDWLRQALHAVTQVNAGAVATEVSAQGFAGASLSEHIKRAVHQARVAAIRRWMTERAEPPQAQQGEAGPDQPK